MAASSNNADQFVSPVDDVSKEKKFNQYVDPFRCYTFACGFLHVDGCGDVQSRILVM